MILPKRIGSFFKLLIQLFYGVPYPELAYINSGDLPELFDESAVDNFIANLNDWD